VDAVDVADVRNRSEIGEMEREERDGNRRERKN